MTDETHTEVQTQEPVAAPDEPKYTRVGITIHPDCQLTLNERLNIRGDITQSSFRPKEAPVVIQSTVECILLELLGAKNSTEGLVTLKDLCPHVLAEWDYMLERLDAESEYECGSDCSCSCHDEEETIADSSDADTSMHSDSTQV